MIALTLSLLIGGFSGEPGRVRTETTSALTLYVATGGSDSHNCTSPSFPCATPAGAYAKVPRGLRHPVTISIGAGTFAGFAVSGLRCQQPVDPAAGRYLLIEGTFATVTPTTGAATGTVSSAATGSSQTFGSIDVTSAGWTSNDFRGKLLEITSGTGAGQIFPIRSNDSDTINIAGVWSPAPNSASTFAVRDGATKLTSSVSNTTRPSIGASLSAGSVANGAAIIFTDNDCASSTNSTSGIAVSKMQLEPTTGRGIAVYGRGSHPLIKWSRILPAANNAIITTDSASVIVYASYVVAPGSSTAILLGNGEFTPSAYIHSNLIRGGGTGLAVAGAGQLLAIQNEFADHSFFAVALSGVTGQLQFNSNRIDCVTPGTRQGINMVMSTAGSAGLGNFMGNAGDISNCGTGLVIEGQGTAYLAGTWTSSGNTTGISMSKGARVRASANVALTGTTEISLDGTTTDYATMRAASPKVTKNTDYGTYLFE